MSLQGQMDVLFVFFFFFFFFFLFFLVKRVTGCSFACTEKKMTRRFCIMFVNKTGILAELRCVHVLKKT